MAQVAPKLLFIGAGNIATSIIKGILNTKPEYSGNIIATAPSNRNLTPLRQLGCQTKLLDKLIESCSSNFPHHDIALLCVKPAILRHSFKTKDMLYQFLQMIPSSCVLLSVVGGIKLAELKLICPDKTIARIMLNTAVEINESSIGVYKDHSDSTSVARAEELLSTMCKSIDQIINLPNESLIDVMTGVCGSGIAYQYEFIQATSDILVKNGLNRSDSTSIAARLLISGGRMVEHKQEHPYKLRDDVSSPAGTTIYGLSAWHEQRVNIGIANAYQAAIDRAKFLCKF